MAFLTFSCKTSMSGADAPRVVAPPFVANLVAHLAHLASTDPDDEEDEDSELKRFLVSNGFGTTAARFCVAMGITRVEYLGALRRQDLDDPDVSFLNEDQKELLIHLAEFVKSSSCMPSDMYCAKEKHGVCWLCSEHRKKLTRKTNRQVSGWIEASEEYKLLLHISVSGQRN